MEGGGSQQTVDHRKRFTSVLRRSRQGTPCCGDLSVHVQDPSLEPAGQLGANPALKTMLAGATLLAFGASDLVETSTGAWYDPWWLFLWKAACVACLLACLGLHFLRTWKEPER